MMTIQPQVMPRPLIEPLPQARNIEARDFGNASNTKYFLSGVSELEENTPSDILTLCLALLVSMALGLLLFGAVLFSLEGSLTF